MKVSHFLQETVEVHLARCEVNVIFDLVRLPHVEGRLDGDKILLLALIFSEIRSQSGALFIADH